MVVKRYLVKDMNEAMSKIRYDLGKDAIIISQRKVRDKGIKGFLTPKLIEVTAAVDNNKENKKSEAINESIVNIKKLINEQKRNIENEQNKTQSNIREDSHLSMEVQEMKAMLNKVLKNTEIKESSKENSYSSFLTDLDIDNGYLEKLTQDLNGSEDLKKDLKKIIEKDIKVNGDDLSGKVVLIGPTGVGKTTTIAKLAGKLSLVDKKKVGLITVDTYRIGAVEQLKTYAEIMNIPFKVVISTKEMEDAIKTMEDLDVILIDTTGRSSKNTMQISELRAFVDKAMAEHIILTISATTKNKDIKTIINGYGQISFNKLIISKLDETTSCGGVYTAIKESNKPIAFITVGQDVPNDIKVPTKEEIINLILGENLI